MPTRSGPRWFLFFVNCGLKPSEITTNNSWNQALIWSLIAAAFIGPGTVATAANAGSVGGYAYLPAVALAALAGYVFMEMAARITIASGQSLGELVGKMGRLLPTLLFAAVLFGCAAYQAGNLLGALEGMRLLFPGLPRWVVLLLGLPIVALLWSGGTRLVARIMAYLVTGMGLLFLVAAARIVIYGEPVSVGGMTDSSILLGLLGTTIVPYNFFLAAGLGAQSSLSAMRRGLLISFLIGGVITASVVVVGSLVTDFTTFSHLAGAIENTLGGYGRLLLGTGLFAAGFSSATTAPLAAAIAGRALLGERMVGGRYRATWSMVLSVGLAVSLFDLDTVWVILLAQIVNGLLLPLIASIIFLLANRGPLLGAKVNRTWQNVAGTLVLCFLWYKAGQFLLGLIF